MSYTVELHRDPPVDEEDLRSLAEIDPELHLDRVGGDSGSALTLVWLPPGGDGTVLLVLSGGSLISTTTPSARQLEKLRDIAAALGARLRGEEGEDLADDDDDPPRANPACALGCLALAALLVVVAILLASCGAEPPDIVRLPAPPAFRAGASELWSASRCWYMVRHDGGSGMQDRLELAMTAAREAGAHQTRSATGLDVSSKGGAELVTRVDVECQEMISRRLRERFPDDAFLGEEGHDQAAVDAQRLWVVDPLDGTNNFVHGIPQFSVSIAYAERGEVLAGVVYDPNRDELFSAVRGGGARLDGADIRVSSRERVAGLMVGTGFYYDRGDTMRRTLATIERLFGMDIRGIRRFGSAALDLCWLACGRLDAFFEYHLSPWDFAAGALIAREAGARLADRDGVPLTLASSSLIGANRHVFDAFLEVTRYER